VTTFVISWKSDSGFANLQHLQRMRHLGHETQSAVQ
jgi:hypothetical protein